MVNNRYEFNSKEIKNKKDINNLDLATRTKEELKKILNQFTSLDQDRCLNIERNEINALISESIRLTNESMCRILKIERELIRVIQSSNPTVLDRQLHNSIDELRATLMSSECLTKEIMLQFNRKYN